MWRQRRSASAFEIGAPELMSPPYRWRKKRYAKAAESPATTVVSNALPRWCAAPLAGVAGGAETKYRSAVTITR